MKTATTLPVQIGLVVASAAVVPLSFPPYGWWPLLLPAFLPLFLATTDTTPRRAFYLGMLHGMIGYGISLYWLGHIFGVGALVLFEILALFTAGFCLCFNGLSKQFESPPLKILLAATLWTAIEFYRSELFFLRFPWITPGSALGPTFLSPILGVYGTSFLVISAAAGFLYRRTIPLAIALSVGVLLLGMLSPGWVEHPSDDAVTVALVQCESCSLGTFVEMTRTTSAESPDLVVWPEYSLPYDVRQNSDDVSVLTDLCAEMDVILIVGTKTVVDQGNIAWHNTALIVDSDGVIGEYYKTRPVHFFNDGIAGQRFEPIHTDVGEIATPICFDCDYTQVTRTMSALGAEFYAVPSCDPAPWSATQHLQHALLFRLRAAENARWLACAASSGVSQVVDPAGNVHASLAPLESGVVTGRIYRSRHLTLFVRGGWLFPWLTLGGSGILLVSAGMKSALRRRKLRDRTMRRVRPRHEAD